MTPQTRHVEAAEKVVYAFMDDPSKISIRGSLTPMIAQALADAENRAAWDGWDTRHRWSNESFQERWHKIEDDFAAKYGPCPEVL